MSTATCNCCLGTGDVPDVFGTFRPCSRCDGDAYRDWSRSREPDAWEVAARQAGWEKNGSRFTRFGGISIAYTDWRTLCIQERIPISSSERSKQGDQ